MNQTSLVQLTQRGGDANRQAQEGLRLHGRAEQPRQEFTAGILEHQLQPTALTGQFQWSDGPGVIQLVLQAEFMGQAIKAGGGWLLGRQARYQHPGTTRTHSLPSAQDTLTIVPQSLQSATHRCRNSILFLVCRTPPVDCRSPLIERVLERLAIGHFHT
ncbi:hypothetical protein D9M68_660820 [compost metagenome]